MLSTNHVINSILNLLQEGFRLTLFSSFFYKCPSHLIPSPAHPTRYSFYIFPGFFAIFILLSFHEATFFSFKHENLVMLWCLKTYLFRNSNIQVKCGGIRQFLPRKRVDVCFYFIFIRLKIAFWRKVWFSPISFFNANIWIY